MKKYSSKSAKGKLDKLVGEHYRKQPCDCIKTMPNHTCAGRIEWVHLKTRAILKTRWMSENCFSLCSKAHFGFHQHPDFFVDWINRNWPGRIDKLNEALQTLYSVKKSDMEELYELKRKELNG